MRTFAKGALFFQKTVGSNCETRGFILHGGWGVLGEQVGHYLRKCLWGIPQVVANRLRGCSPWRFATKADLEAQPLVMSGRLKAAYGRLPMEAAYGAYGCGRTTHTGDC